MPDLRVDRPREETVRLVEAVLSEMPAVVGYAVDGETVTADLAGGLTSVGSTLRVEVPRDQDDPGATVFSVAAARNVALNLTANPHRHKTAFIERVHAYRDVPGESLPDPASAREPDAMVVSGEGDDADAALPGEAGEEEPVPMVAARLFFWMLVAAVGLVALATAVGLLL